MTAPAEDEDLQTFLHLRKVETGGLSTQQAARLQRTRSDTSNKHSSILVADDARDTRRIIVQMLTKLGYENLCEAQDGEATMEILRRQEFDLLILDIEMPRMDGFGVLGALKADPALCHLPVIVASGLNQLDAVVKCIELGAEDFLPKPVNPVILHARIAACLERKRLRDFERLQLLESQLERQLLEIEKEKSERLLLNILPVAIAERLKRESGIIAERHASVTVLFADIIDFTSFANHTDPEELVSLLNDLFSRFDQVAERHGLEKIKTIGDSYLVVGGLLDPKSNHAVAVAEMALEMLTALGELNRERGTSLCLRIGLNSGPVVAGVIGRKKFAYDLWGAAVNVANRMQSSGLPNKIQVPAGMIELLGDKFLLTERGVVDCKGLGQIRTYLLESRTAPAVAAPAPALTPESRPAD
jgi:class 3 adenylate cyclase